MFSSRTVYVLKLLHLYVVWGITTIDGLSIDGIEATPEALVECGPESLVREAATLVRSQLGLNEEERKN